MATDSAATNNETPSKHFYRHKELIPLLGVSGSAIWLWTRNKKFPQPVKLAENTTAWKASDIDAWVQSRVAAGQK